MKRKRGPKDWREDGKVTIAKERGIFVHELKVMGSPISVFFFSFLICN